MVEVAESTDVTERLRAHEVTSLEQLHAINGEPSPEILSKHTDHLTPLLCKYIEASPFFLLATADAAGNCDVSPRGDPPGAVLVLDERTIALPDRLGNRRGDGHRNVLENPHVGLLFVVPNVDESVRVNGRAFLTTEPDLLDRLSQRGRAPKLAVVVEIDEVYVHCARSFLRAGMWKPETWPNPDSVPTLAAMMREQKGLPPPDESKGKRQEAYRSTLY